VKSLLSVSLIALIAVSTAAADDSGFVAANPPAMEPLKNPDSPAHQTAKWFRHGVNLGDYLEVEPGHGWGVTCSADEIVSMRAEGFDHVRVPVGWHHYTGPAPDFVIAPEFFRKVDFVITNALANQLAVIINLHHFNAFDRDPRGQTDKLLAIWRQVAAHYASFTNRLVFELLNEPHENAVTSVVNPIYERLIAEIRRTNPRRTLIVMPGGWGGPTELNGLVLPAHDDNLIVSVHCYDPFYFTHQGAGWAGEDVKVTGIQFPGPPTSPLVPDSKLNLRPWVADWIQRYNTLPSDRNPSGPSAFEGKLRFVRAWSDHYGRPVYIGEFGCFINADLQSRVRFYSAFRRALDANQLGWAMWDWSANFRYWDQKNIRPVTGMREALFK
jgi:endoglucanase